MTTNPFSDANPAIISLVRNDVKILSRLKALEAMIVKAVPSEEREAWEQELEKQYGLCLQVTLEAYEAKSPGFAALLDTRDSDELSDLEW